MNARATALFLLLLSGPAIAQKVPYREIAIPVRDGQSLAADLYLLDSTAAKPLILVQTPYNKNRYRLGFGAGVSGNFPWRPEDYQYLIVDWRGFYGSTGADSPGYDRGLDGYDIVEWAASQPWCNGKIGTWGGSALGQIQFLTARRKPPHLVCAAPAIKDYKTKYSDFYCGGVLRTEHVESLERLGFITVDAVVSHPTNDIVWNLAERNSDYPEEIAVPMLLTSGWFDHFPSDVLRAYEDLRTRSDATVRDAHKLIMGPWTHEGVDQEEQGELVFPDAAGKARDEALRFFDYHLLGAKNGWPMTPRVQYYECGSERWISGTSWPPPQGTRIVRWFLHAAGRLDMVAPSPGSTDATVIPYDPRNPSPSWGGARFNPFDPTVVPGPLDIRSKVESRPDAAVFSTPPVPDGTDLTILGPGRVQLLVSSDRTDTDFAVRLCDVYPDGRSMILTDGIVRLRFRNGTAREEPLPPGTVDTVTIALTDLAWRVLPGHALRLVVTSSNWPRYDRNLNNGGAMYAPGDSLPAYNTVYHGGQWSSRLELRCAEPGSAVDRMNAAPARAALLPVAPHPLRTGAGTAVIPFTLPARTHVRLAVHDVAGRQVGLLVDDALPAGLHHVTWDGRGAAGAMLPAGVCLLLLHTPAGTVSRTMLLLR